MKSYTIKPLKWEGDKNKYNLKLYELLENKFRELAAKSALNSLTSKESELYNALTTVRNYWMEHYLGKRIEHSTKIGDLVKIVWDGNPSLDLPAIVGASIYRVTDVCLYKGIYVESPSGAGQWVTSWIKVR